MSLVVARTIAQARALVAEARRQGRSIEFVPTMGALHEGHGSLMDLARRPQGFLVVSIFVNPIQFDRADDYERYPRTLEADVEFCRRRGVDLVFAPSIEEMYPQPQRAFVEVTGLTEHLCGRFRPGHFRGVATVVTKLFGIVQPDRAYFGEKDAQQLAVVRRMVRDLNMPVEIVACPTVREADGLAMSSRNGRLSPAERSAASAIYRALQAAAAQVRAGARDPAVVRRAGLALLQAEPLLRPEYFDIVDPEEIQPVLMIESEVLIACAAWAGTTRLIDSLRATPPLNA
ncbi:MAG: pantoate--beta-alanine ligase [Bryobacterales bacterium]|nr:pantoate--beta-alanine ligase [Bryobacteraceae bacterium]MDW8131889.1 pantoate--beta-alanine ligase [Bryobacterales bacterium]